MHKNKIAFLVPAQLQVEFRQKIKDKYGMRGKSKWIAEAIQELLKLENYIELVNLGDEMSTFDKKESIEIDTKMKKALDDAVLKIRQTFPLLEGVQSRIIRTSIVQRLIRT